MIKQCTVNEAVQLVNSTEEIGFLDLREIGPFSEGHPLFAVPVPFSVFEERVAKLVPRPGSRLLLIDGGDGLAPTAAETLREMGYRDITLVDGGIPRMGRGRSYTLRRRERSVQDTRRVGGSAPPSETD